MEVVAAHLSVDKEIKIRLEAGVKCNALLSLGVFIY